MTDILVPILLLVVIALAALVIGRNKKASFDERQLFLRARGYQLGFFVTLACCAAVLVLTEVGALPAASVSLAVYIALLAGVVSFAVFCIVKDVFFGLGMKDRYYIILAAVVVLSDAIGAVGPIMGGTLLENGAPTLGGFANIVTGLGFLVILASLLIRHFRREEE